MLRFRAVARDAACGDLPGLTPVWSLSPGDGQVEQDGTFVPYLPGTYTITASLGSTSAEATVRVRARDVRREATIVGRLPLSKLPTTDVDELTVDGNGFAFTGVARADEAFEPVPAALI